MHGGLGHQRQDALQFDLGADPLAETIERGKLGRAARRRISLRARMPRQAAGNDRDDQEGEQAQDILRVGDQERVERRDEEEIERQEGQHRGQDRRPQAKGAGADQHYEEIQQGDVGLIDAGKQLGQRQSHQHYADDAQPIAPGGAPRAKRVHR